MRWVVVRRFRYITQQPEPWEEIGRSYYRWRWLARLMNPIGIQLWDSGFGPVFIWLDLLSTPTTKPRSAE